MLELSTHKAGAYKPKLERNIFNRVLSVDQSVRQYLRLHVNKRTLCLCKQCRSGLACASARADSKEIRVGGTVSRSPFDSKFYFYGKFWIILGYRLYP